MLLILKLFLSLSFLLQVNGLIKEGSAAASPVVDVIALGSPKINNVKKIKTPRTYKFKYYDPNGHRMTFVAGQNPEDEFD